MHLLEICGKFISTRTKYKQFLNFPVPNQVFITTKMKFHMKPLLFKERLNKITLRTSTTKIFAYNIEEQAL